MVWSPEVRRVVGDGDEGGVSVVDQRLVDEFLRFAASRRGRTRCVPMPTI
jgi:hypothetical protein